MNKNSELFERSKKVVPGGVHSPVRSFKGLHTTPIFFEKGEGAYLFDVEGKSYIDFCMSFGPLILGHNHPAVLTAISDQLKRGLSFGAAEPYSLKLAEFIVEKLPFIEQVRFMNSGTEAVMTAIRLARGVTKKDKILKFSGCYHGHTDALLIKAGSGLAGTAEASSAGVPKGVAQDTLVLDLGDTEGVIKCFETYPNQIAAIIIEPLPANNGLLVQKNEFLHFLRDITQKYQSLLIFDEVISGFRVALGGMSEKLKITPDIVTFGKIIGGGLPVGAVASTKFIMEHLAPIGNVYQAGTLSGNPLAMAAGLATLNELTPKLYAELEHRTALIANTFNEWFLENKEGQFRHLSVVHEASLFWIVSKKNISNLSEIPQTLSSDFFELFKTLLPKGIYLAPNAYEVGFVSMAHDQKVLDELKKRLGK